MNIDGLAKKYLHELITIILSESFALYYGNFCQQIVGVAMDSQFEATLAVIFLCFDKQELWQCSADSKPIIYRAFNLCPDFEIFHQDIIIFKDILKRNRCPIVSQVFVLKF